MANQDESPPYQEEPKRSLLMQFEGNRWLDCLIWVSSCHCHAGDPFSVSNPCVRRSTCTKREICNAKHGGLALPFTHFVWRNLFFLFLCVYNESCDRVKSPNYCIGGWTWLHICTICELQILLGLHTNMRRKSLHRDWGFGVFLHAYKLPRQLLVLLMAMENSTDPYSSSKQVPTWAACSMLSVGVRSAAESGDKCEL